MIADKGRGGRVPRPFGALSAPRECEERAAAQLTQRDVIPNYEAQIQLATALGWDLHVRSLGQAAPYRKTNGKG